MLEGVFGGIQSFQVNNNGKVGKSENTAQAGMDFKNALMDITRSANMTVANGSTAGSLQFNRRKEELVDEPFSFTEAEQEIAEEYVNRIKKLLKELRK